MDNINLNLTETCFGCRKSAARWMLQISGPDYAILFCPVCDAMTPEDLEVSDTRIITLPTPSTPVTSQTPGYQLTFNGAQQYRMAMGPERPFRVPGTKTMRRRYKNDGTEVV